jgi:glycosyltransferase involved in cell wall biosynthesis
MTAFDVSVLVCTQNRCARLPDFMDGLNALDLRSIKAELILVDNASSDDTASVLRRLAKASPFAHTAVLSVGGALSAAKNAALKKATGDLVVFTDDDCFPDADWLVELKRFFDEHPNAHVAGGHVRLFDPEDYPMTITVEENVSPTMSASTALWASVHGCNLAFRRASLIDIGGFDEKLGPGTAAQAAEDRDAIYRMARTHGGFYYVPEARLRHHHGRRESDIAPLLKSYEAGEQAFWFKHASRGDWRVVRMTARVMSWKLDWSSMSKPMRIARVAKAMVVGYFRGRKVYQAASAP